MDFGNLINDPLNQMAFFHLGVGNYVVILVALVFLYLAVKRGSKSLLPIPITFDMLLVNIYPEIIYSPGETPNDTGGLLWYFFQPDEWSILPSFIFLGVEAMTDSGPLTTSPISPLMGATAQLGIYSAYFLTILLGSSGRESATIPIIEGTGGLTSLFLCNRLGQTQVMRPIVVAAYSYMALVPIIQLPFMGLLTTEKECKIKMEQFRPVFRLEKILSPIIVTVVVCLILPSTAPFVDMLVLDSLSRESGVVKQSTDTASNALMYIVVILLGTSVSTATSTEAFLNVTTTKVVVLGLTTLIFGTTGGMFLGKLLRKLIRGRTNPLVGSADVSAIPMVVCVSQKVGAEADPTNFLLVHAMGPNVVGAINTVAAISTFMTVFGV